MGRVPQNASSIRLPFAAVNRRGDANYQEGWQRHHLVPKQCGSDSDLGPFLNALRLRNLFIDDFTTNGIMLPALDSLSRENGLPLHVGGHAAYNVRVMTQLHAIRMSCERVQAPQRHTLAVMGIRALQAQLRESIQNQSGGVLDSIPIRGRSDRDIDSLIGTLFASRNRLAAAA